LNVKAENNQSRTRKRVLYAVDDYGSALLCLLIAIFAPTAIVGIVIGIVFAAQ
jgi:hypothetical protein